MRTSAIIAFLALLLGGSASAQAEEIGVTHQLAADAGFTPGIVRAAAGTEQQDGFGTEGRRAWGGLGEDGSGSDDQQQKS